MFGNLSPRKFTPQLPPIGGDSKIQYLEERIKKQEDTTQALLGSFFFFCNFLMNVC